MWGAKKGVNPKREHRHPIRSGRGESQGEEARNCPKVDREVTGWKRRGRGLRLGEPKQQNSVKGGLSTENSVSDSKNLRGEGERAVGKRNAGKEYSILDLRGGGVI